MLQLWWEVIKTSPGTSSAVAAASLVIATRETATISTVAASVALTISTSVTTADVLVIVLAPALATLVVFGKFWQLNAALNVEIKTGTFLILNVVEVVHKAIKLVFINIKQSSELVFDALDDSDVVSGAPTPPSIEDLPAIGDCQPAIVIC